MPTIQETIQKVRAFAELREGWHFGEGMAPSEERIEQAEAFLEYANLTNLERANAFPGVRGQVEVTFYNADRMLEITIESDDSITIAEDRDREQISFEENLSKSDAYQRLEEFGQSIWASSDHFIVSTTTQNVRVAVLQVAPWISEAENRFLSWIRNVQKERAVQYVHILPGTTTSRLAIPKSTGQYAIVIYQPIAESSLSEPRTATTVIGTSTIGVETPPERLLNA